MTETVFELVVTRPSGAGEKLSVRATRLLVGGGAHCDVRVEGAGREHVVLELHGGEILATAKHFAPRPTLGGRPFFQAQLGRAGEIAVAGTRIYVQAVQVTEKKSAVRARLVSVVALCLAAALVPGFVFLALRAPDDGRLGPPPQKHAVLFSGASADCRAPADQAGAAGAQKLALAGLQRERHPFDVTEGVAAVSSFEVAAACFTRAGMDGEAKSARRAGDTLRSRIDADYRVHRVRLEHALESDDERAALREVHVLRRLTSERTGEYVDWLGAAERHLERRIRAAKKVR